MARQRRFGGNSGARSVAVIGLGRFGEALALELMEYGAEVLGVDGSEAIVQALDTKLTHVVVADATNENTLRQLAIADFDRIVLAIGSDIQASILTASQLVRLGARDVWAKAVTEQHAIILEQLGVGHVIRPEADMGRRVAHMVVGSMEDFLEIDTGLVAIQIAAPESMLAVPLRELGLAEQCKVQISAISRAGTWLLANKESRLESGDRILVIGAPSNIDAFAAQV